MQCEDVALAIQQELSGATSPIELGRRLPLAVHQHLERCYDCREGAQDMVALERLLRKGLVEVTPPPDLTAQIMAAVRAQSALSVVPPADNALPVPTRPRRLPTWAAAVALGCVAALADYAFAAAGVSVGTPWAATFVEEWSAFAQAWNDTLVWLLASLPQPFLTTWGAAPSPWAIALGCAVLVAIAIFTIRWDGGTRQNA